MWFLVGVLLLTPTNTAQFEDVADVGAVDSDYEHVEMESFNGHPGQGTEQEVVQEDSSGCTQPGLDRSLRLTGQECHTEKKEGPQEVHVNLCG